MSRSFTIESAEKMNGQKINYTEGRFKSDTPRQAARKMFSKIYSYLNITTPLILKITLRETTQGSNKKHFSYKVSKQSQKKTIERDGKLITFNYITKIESSKKVQSGRGSKFNYAVVEWFNYRKDLSAGFISGFSTFEEARSFAYDLANTDKKEWKLQKIVTYVDYQKPPTDKIDSVNGPGIYGSPYAGETMIAYGASGSGEPGYSTLFYCVVPWFEGVENDWNDSEDDEYWEELYGDEWYPQYSY